MISSRQNEKIKNLFKLLQKKHRDLTDTFLVFGEHGITEAIKTENVIEIFTTNNNKKGTLISTKIMKELSPLLSITERVAVAKKQPAKSITNKVLILDGIQDPGNLGTLIRSAVAFGFLTIIANADTVDFYNEKTVSATQGNLFYANLIKDDLSLTIKKLKEQNYQIVATDTISGKSLKELKTTEKTALILGSEGKGIKEEIKELANVFIKIETANVESLNVGVAGSIMMYELGDKNDQCLFR